jgi:hypothetical protein
MSRDRHPPLRDVTADTENAASSIVACWTVLTELLPGNALIKSVKICTALEDKKETEDKEKCEERERKYFYHLGYNAVYSVENQLTFQRNLAYFFDPESGKETPVHFQRTIQCYILGDITLHIVLLSVHFYMSSGFHLCSWFHFQRTIQCYIPGGITLHIVLLSVHFYRPS